MAKVSDLNPNMHLPVPDRATLQALARLSDNTDFATLFDYMDKSLKDQDKKNRVTREDTPLRQGQGISQALESLMQLSLSAKDMLRRTGS